MFVLIMIFTTWSIIRIEKIRSRALFLFDICVEFGRKITKKPNHFIAELIVFRQEAPEKGINQ